MRTQFVVVLFMSVLLGDLTEVWAGSWSMRLAILVIFAIVVGMMGNVMKRADRVMGVAIGIFTVALCTLAVATTGDPEKASGAKFIADFAFGAGVVSAVFYIAAFVSKLPRADV